MSGGVDSSVAALLLKEQGYQVVGITLRLFKPPQADTAAPAARSCCSLEDVDDARAVCRLIQSRHLLMNAEKEFSQFVLNYFISEYANGRTPIPCRACNDHLKFDFLMRRANSIGADFVATGHYARKIRDGARWAVATGVDPSKDQSYVLYNLTQAQLDRILFPIGEYTKDQIRAIARKHGARVADKPDSQDICFIPAGNYKEFITPRISTPKPGRILDRQGNQIARHSGIHQFTIGQRKGIPPLNSAGTAHKQYVTEIDPASGDVMVGNLQDLASTTAYASQVNWISGQPPAAPAQVRARIRYSGMLENAAVRTKGSWAEVAFQRPVRAVTPGQAVVFYTGSGTLLGGGTIESSRPSGTPFAQPLTHAA